MLRWFNNRWSSKFFETSVLLGSLWCYQTHLIQLALSWRAHLCMCLCITMYDPLTADAFTPIHRKGGEMWGLCDVLEIGQHNFLGGFSVTFFPLIWFPLSLWRSFCNCASKTQKSPLLFLSDVLPLVAPIFQPQTPARLTSVSCYSVN